MVFSVVSGIWQYISLWKSFFWNTQKLFFFYVGLVLNHCIFNENSRENFNIFLYFPFCFNENLKSSNCLILYGICLNYMEFFKGHKNINQNLITIYDPC